MTRRIHIITGARSEYDLLSPAIEHLHRDPRVSVGIIACAAHLSPFHGNTVDLIRADGFPIVAEVPSLMASDGDEARALSFSNLIDGLSRQLHRDRPDLVVVTGDREEALAGALAANFLKIHVAHVHGGDRCIASDIDEVFRPTISKLAHIHCAATEGHRERLIRMGEAPEHVYATGAPGLDRFVALDFSSDEELLQNWGIPVDARLFLVIHHPVAWLKGQDAAAEIDAILGALSETDAWVLCSYPNSDQGNVSMRACIDRRRNENSRIVPFHTLPRRDFVAAYRRCAAIIGNSSSINIESGIVGVPGILVGDRQKYREHGDNVIAVSPDPAAIAAAVDRAINDVAFIQQARTGGSPYGDGQSGPRIADILATTELTDDMLLKTMPY